jgi:hypothetical protein
LHLPSLLTVTQIIRLDSVFGESPVEHGGQGNRDSVHEDVLPMVDDRLHEILLGVYGQRIDPIVRVLHWPSFLEKCRIFRQGTLAHVQTTATPNYPGAYAQTSPVTTYTNPTNLLPQRSTDSKSLMESSSIGSAFVALLYSVYCAAMASICHSTNQPDLGQNINPVTLWSTFQKEVSSRITLVDGKYVRTESVEMLQAIVLYMVWAPINTHQAYADVCEVGRDRHVRFAVAMAAVRYNNPHGSVVGHPSRSR